MEVGLSVLAFDVDGVPVLVDRVRFFRSESRLGVVVIRVVGIIRVGVIRVLIGI
jgi:hypothetical protein